MRFRRVLKRFTPTWFKFKGIANIYLVFTEDYLRRKWSVFIDGAIESEITDSY